jgi:uncharacterized repeat protein (TIGR01451 family)
MRRAIHVLLAAIVMGFGAGPRPAGAAPGTGHTYVVNSSLDEPDADVTNGVCAGTPSGLCTLRAALMQSNYATGPNIISLPAGTYTITRSGYDDTALLGDLDISHDVTIQGAGSAATIVDGNGAIILDRTFQVLTGTQHVDIAGLTIRGGQAADPTDAFGHYGGGLRVDGLGLTTLTDVILAGNTAQYGGGLATRQNNHAAVTLAFSQVFSNAATAGGGGVYIIDAALLLDSSQVHGNTADWGGGLWTAYSQGSTVVDSIFRDNAAGQAGGGLYAYASYLTLAGSTFNDNVADRGGGLFADSTQSTLVNSTLSGNVASQVGGGLYLSRGQAKLLNDTVAGNQVLYTVALQPGLGGGIYLTSTAVTAQNSIIATNTRRSHKGALADDDCSANGSTGGFHYNLFTTLDNCTLILGLLVGNLVGPDPLLGPLQLNGGATPTRALAAGSPAIDAADPSGCVDWNGSPLTKDQRGAARVDGHCDMGAYERVPEADLAVGLRASPNPARPGAPLTYTLDITNTGPDQATSVQLIDTLPLSATFAAASPSQGSCFGTSTIVCNLGALASGAPATVTLVVTPTAAGLFTNRIAVNATTFDPLLANNSATETTTVAALRKLYLPLVRR